MIASQTDARMRSDPTSTSAFLPTPSGAAARSRSTTPSRRPTAAQASRETAWARSFVAVAEVSGEAIGRGSGRTKKQAEQEAAEEALDLMEDED